MTDVEDDGDAEDQLSAHGDYTTLYTQHSQSLFHNSYPHLLSQVITDQTLAT